MIFQHRMSLLVSLTLTLVTVHLIMLSQSLRRSCSRLQYHSAHGKTLVFRHRGLSTTLKARKESSTIVQPSPILNAGSTVYRDFSLLNNLSNLKGCGPKTIEMLAQLNIHSITDLLMHFPRSIIDRSKVVEVSNELVGEIVTVEGTVASVKEGFNGSPCVVLCQGTNNTRFRLTFFMNQAMQKWFQATLKKTYYPGAHLIISGKLTISSFTQSFDIVNPDFSVSASAEAELDKYLVVEPRYGLTDGMSSSKLKSMVKLALEFAQDELGDYFKNDWLPSNLRSQYGWPTMLEALQMAHSPQSTDSLSIMSAWRQRLAFDEFVALQTKQLKNQSDRKQQLFERQLALLGPDKVSDGYVVKGTGVFTNLLLENLPFKLTNCQRTAIDEVWEHMGTRERMVRCVQGDVGSGKTLVAILAMLRAVEDGKQAAMLAPTEILAKQHYNVIREHLQLIRTQLTKSDGKVHTRPTVALLTGGLRGKKRESLLEEIRSGNVDVIVGTHALLTDSASSSMAALGLVCIDEEQRFGVEQRDFLGDRTNVIYTTATPIPRSLMLVAQEGHSISTLVEKPPTKRPIQTSLVGISHADRLIERIRLQIPNGSKVFWVTPCLQPSSSMIGSSALERFEQLSAIFPGKVALLHGKMSSEEKEESMERFSERDGEISILVSTTVVEVGVDVPDASICVIDRAENFGLSQIHQIRGRIGRGLKPDRETLDECFCVLLYQDLGESDADALSPKAKLQILARSNDGFEIAESDLKLRGPGDIFGLRQHGSADYRAASVMDHSHLLGDAMKMAIEIFNASSTTKQAEKVPENAHLQAVLSMFLTHRKQLLSLGTVSTQTSATSIGMITAEKSVVQIADNRIKKDNAKFVSVRAPIDIDLTSSDSIIVLFDIESTGLSVTESRIIQMACKVVGSDIGQFNNYVLPNRDLPLPKVIVDLTGITSTFLKEQGVSFSEAFSNLRSWLKSLKQRPSQKIILAAHNGGRFDFPMLAAEVNRNRPASHANGEVSWVEDCHVDALLDTLTLLGDDSLWEQKPKSLSQPKLYKAIIGRDLTEAHNAVYDVKALEEILESKHAKLHLWKTVGNRLLFR